jgi:hypothetical protein
MLSEVIGRFSRTAGFFIGTFPKTISSSPNSLPKKPRKEDGIPSGARHRTGTMQFMAIEVLEGKGHTYRHDLESFFYVFV